MKPEPKKVVTRGIEEEPSVGSGQIPVVFFAVLAGFLFLGLLYLDKFAGGFNSMVYGPYYNYDQVAALQPMDPTAELAAKGKRVYDTACMICHQASGDGTAGQFPPLNGSEWVTGPVNRLIRIPLHGLSGPITVKGQAWDAAMPNAGAAFTDDQVAALLTYVRKAFGSGASPVTVEQVKKVRDETKDRSSPWTGKELLDLKAE